MNQYTTRFTCYATAHGMQPEDVRSKDGNMLGFISWNSKKLREWKALNGRAHDAPMRPADQAAYDTWLSVTRPV